MSKAGLSGCCGSTVITLVFIGRNDPIFRIFHNETLLNEKEHNNEEKRKKKTRVFLEINGNYYNVLK